MRLLVAMPSIRWINTLSTEDQQSIKLNMSFVTMLDTNRGEL